MKAYNGYMAESSVYSKPQKYFKASGQLHTHRYFTPGTHTGEWKGPRAGLDVDVRRKTLPLLGIKPLPFSQMLVTLLIIPALRMMMMMMMMRRRRRRRRRRSCLIWVLQNQRTKLFK
jgi:hypothetical protein